MLPVRAIAVLFLALGFALGSVAGAVAATEQAFADPCPMHKDGNKKDGDGPCCKDKCAAAMTGCAAKCSAPFYAAALPALIKVVQVAKRISFVAGSNAYDPFLTRPPPPIPIV